MKFASKMFGRSPSSHNALSRSQRSASVQRARSYEDNGATLDDLREAVTTYEETERTSRRVLGGAHPTTTGIEKCLGEARAVLRARETLPMSA